ncbi:hypothetical protein EJ06DRAFT_534463 [Trichodelitschia bisporula]|uniref:Uncharacterized protein n=1 Tax=Trichodelitschia bisporula TaxID=703511 RepID=A0A6G1HJ43_9PEZI|nr:hypothetical protein EJ06DRAFT_534463 [Trichodelitschia bisporula]
MESDVSRAPQRRYPLPSLPPAPLLSDQFTLPLNSSVDADNGLLAEAREIPLPPSHYGSTYTATTHHYSSTYASTAHYSSATRGSVRRVFFAGGVGEPQEIVTRGSVRRRFFTGGVGEPQERRERERLNVAWNKRQRKKMTGLERQRKTREWKEMRSEETKRTEGLGEEVKGLLRQEKERERLGKMFGKKEWLHWLGLMLDCACAMQMTIWGEMGLNWPQLQLQWLTRTMQMMQELDGQTMGREQKGVLKHLHGALELYVHVQGELLTHFRGFRWKQRVKRLGACVVKSDIKAWELEQNLIALNTLQEAFKARKQNLERELKALR